MCRVNRLFLYMYSIKIIDIWKEVYLDCIVHILYYLFRLWGEMMQIIDARIAKASGEYVDFGDLVRDRIGMQCQYASRYLDGTIEGYPRLGEGLRIAGCLDEYHTLLIHKCDAEEFLRRLIEYRESRRRHA